MDRELSCVLVFQKIYIQKNYSKVDNVMKKSVDKLINIFIFFLLLLYFNAAAGQSDSSNQVKHVLRIADGLKAPLRIAVGSQDLIYVTDPIQGKICKYDLDGNLAGEFIAGRSPLAIAATSEEMLYIADRLSGELWLLDSSGSLVKKITSDSGYFELPSCAVINEENHLYIVDSKKKSVRIFDANGDAIGSFGDDILRFPTGIAFDRKNHRILIAEHG